MGTLTKGRITDSNSKFKNSAIKLIQSKKNLDVLGVFNQAKDDVAARVTRKAGLLALSDQVKLMKSIENGNSQVIQDFALFNVQMIDQPLNLPTCHEFNQDVTEHKCLLIKEYTILELSAHYGRSSIVELLLKCGANPNRQPTNPLGDTPLHIAIK